MVQEEINDVGMTAEEKLIKRLKKMEDAGMARTKKWVANWQQSLRYFFSDQLYDKKVHSDWDYIVLNYIWPSAIAEIAKLSRNHARIICNPQDATDAEYSEAWQAAFRWLWQKGINKRGMRIEQIYASLVSKIYGYTVSKVFWEDKNVWDNGAWRGDVRHKIWHPSEFWSSATENIDDGDCGTVRYVDLEYAIHRWPQYKTKFEDKAQSFKGANGGQVVRGQTSVSGTYPSTGSGGKDTGPKDVNHLVSLILQSEKSGGQQTSLEPDRKFVKISGTYFRDYEEETINEITELPAEELLKTGQITQNNGMYYDNNGSPISEWPTITNKKKVPKFPYGRYVIWCEDFVINKDDQVYPYSRWPFVVKPHYLLPFMWQGLDAVSLFKTTQDGINIAVSHLFNNMKQFGDPRVAVEDDAISAPPKGKKKFRIFSGAGSIIRLKRGAINRYKIEQPVPPSAAEIQLYSLFAQEYKNLQGLQDISLGKKTKGEISATEASVLAISSNDRIHLQSVFEDEWVKQVATLVAEICQDRYEVDRLIRIIGEDSKAGVLTINQKMKDVRIDIDIEPGQTLPFDEDRRLAKYERAYAILQQPIPNPMTPEMLRILEIPNWQKLLTRYEAWQQYVQFLELYNAVKTGEVDPQDAVNILTRKAMEVYTGEQANTVPTQGEQNVRSNTQNI